MHTNETQGELLPGELEKREISRVIKKKVHRIEREFTDAFELINRYDKSVTFFGSARFKEDNDHYQQAKALAKKISAEGYTILTGGGGGIMEAANRGAFEAGKESVGLNIRLPHEQSLNQYTHESMQFNYFFIRKVALSFAAEAYVFFPGGFGTCDELFEMLTLIQTHKIRRVPVILVGEGYWNELDHFIKKQMTEEHQTINVEDMDIYTITEDEDEILRIIKEVPVRPMIQRK
ncbi:MAG: TIGR00730 family Rossman fold protein [Candidatus Taylorbacteria bacterium]|nr:TIGR00730 family Rossman fold protein [Candidatus Taylorbacteria bacterium]